MERITEKMLRARFALLCKALHKRVAVDWKDVGAWFLDEYLGRWEIREYSLSGGESQPFGCGNRMTKRELFDCMSFGLRALAVKQDPKNESAAFWPKECLGN